MLPASLMILFIVLIIFYWYEHLSHQYKTFFEIEASQNESAPKLTGGNFFVFMEPANQNNKTCNGQELSLLYEITCGNFFENDILFSL